MTDVAITRRAFAITSSVPPAPHDVARIQRRTMTVLVVMQIIGTVGVGVAPSIGVLLAGEVTNSETWAGLARTSSTLGAALLGLPLGDLAARRGRRVSLATGWWTAAVGGGLLVLSAQLDLVVPLFIGLLLIGAGSAVSLQARFAATDLAEPQYKARSLALVVWVGTIGSVLGPNLGVPAEALGRVSGLTVYAGAFLIAAVCLAIAGTVAVVWLRPDPLQVLARVNPPAPRLHTGARAGRFRAVAHELGGNQPARFALVAILTAQIVMAAIMTMTPVHLTHHGDSITVIGLTISLHVAGMYALAPAVGVVVARGGHRLAIAIGIAVLAASLVAGAARPDDTAWIVASLILLGVGWSFVNVAGSALFSAVVSDRARASSQGGVDALSNLCGATAAFVAGPLLAVSSFSALAWIALATLLPLTVMTALAPRSATAQP